MPGKFELSVRETLGRLAPHAATTFFVVLSVATYVAASASSGFSSQPRPFVALRWGALVGELGVIEPWRFLSAMFVHFGLFHLGLNTLALHSLGKNVESSLGSARFTLIFLGSGIGGFVASQLWYAARQLLTGGISGGLFGLLGAAAGWRFSQRDPAWKRDAISGVAYAGVMALLPGIQVNHAAHLGGLITGALIAWALHRWSGHGRPSRALRGAAAALVALTFVSIVLSLVSSVTRFRGIS